MEKLSKRTEERKEAVFYLYQFDLMKTHNISYEGEFTKYLVDNIILNIEKIDELIKKCLTSYSLNRLSYVDRAIIRLATFEMMNKDLPYNVIINEALEITKIYTNLDEDKEKAFNNKLLDNIKNYLEKEE